MPNPFAITTTTNTVSLDDKRRNEVSFTVSNKHGGPIRGRAQLEPQAPTSAAAGIPCSKAGAPWAAALALR